MADELVRTSTAIEGLSKGLARSKSFKDLTTRPAPVKRSVLLVDCSYSMDATVKSTGKRKIDQLRVVVADLLKTHPVPVAAFGLNTGDAVALVTGPIPEPAGGTPLHTALLFAKEIGADHAIVVSDGRPDNETQALEAAQGFGGQVDAFFIGDEGDEGARFLTRLTRACGGTTGVTNLSSPAQLTAGIKGLLGTGGGA